MRQSFVALHWLTLLMTGSCYGIFSLNLLRKTYLGTLTKHELKHQMAKANESPSETGSRRRRRLREENQPFRGSVGSISPPTEDKKEGVAGTSKIIEPTPKASDFPSLSTDSELSNSRIKVPLNDGTSSLEDMFGLGDEMLTELLETELPVAREDLSTGPSRHVQR